ncbi:hypothetical protein Lal_00037329 [Lupinus albus]|nr:hypothetical protein Lal_00037329 [Lupinus albus]
MGSVRRKEKGEDEGGENREFSRWGLLWSSTPVALFRIHVRFRSSSRQQIAREGHADEDKPRFLLYFFFNAA